VSNYNWGHKYWNTFSMQNACIVATTCEIPGRDKSIKSMKVYVGESQIVQHKSGHRAGLSWEWSVQQLESGETCFSAVILSLPIRSNHKKSEQWYVSDHKRLKSHTLRLMNSETQLYFIMQSTGDLAVQWLKMQSVYKIWLIIKWPSWYLNLAQGFWKTKQIMQHVLKMQ